jgi:choice-of-anchor B domain-containing protein
MSQLPSTVTVVHDGTTYFERGHTIYVDGDKMYVGSVTYTAGGPSHSSMNIYSLATPTAPALLRRLDQDYNFISVVHDMFVLNDTVYASCGTQGLYVFLWQNSTMTFTQLGSYTGYAGSNYNHSSWITSNRQNLVFCDEVPTAQPIRLVNVTNLQNIQPVSTFNPHPNTTPHNPYVLGNNFAVVACYQDGLNIYNISNPSSPFLAGFFDTHPQEGANTGNYNGADYRGNWGAYPYLPSGIVIATDMQNGVFILDPAQSFVQVAGIESHSKSASNLIFFPNPASDKIAVHYNTSSPSVIQIKNILGQLVYEKHFESDIHEYIPVKELKDGTYMLTLIENGNTATKKLIVSH